MTRVNVFCEGQTEDVFVREVLGPHFQRRDIWLNPIIVRTSSRSKGGVSSYGKIKRQVEIKCKEDTKAWVTTFLDYYGLPRDFPGTDSAGGSLTRAGALEAAFEADIAEPNFIPNVVVHEFEALLFSKPGAFAEYFDDADVVRNVAGVRARFDTPEHINDDRNTAPSKRLLSICDSYDKVLHGSLIALEIGLETIRGECRRFDAWIRRLEGLAGT